MAGHDVTLPSILQLLNTVSWPHHTALYSNLLGTQFPLSAVLTSSFYSAKPHLGFGDLPPGPLTPPSSCPVFPQCSFISSCLSSPSTHSIHLMNYLPSTYDARQWRSMGNKICASRSLAIVQGEVEVELGRTQPKAQVTILYC